MYLAIDTSTGTAGLALIFGRHLVAEDTWCCTRNHSVELMPHITSILAKAKADTKDIAGIIVARGPGSFNGLRVGLGTAKGLAFGLGIPIASISTLSAAAYQHAATWLPICAILPAGRSEIAWAIYQDIDGKWLNSLPETISGPGEVYSYVTEPTVFAGEPSDELLHEIRLKLAGRAVIPSSPKSRVCALAELGARRLDANEQDDVATLQPMYLRRPPITQPKPRTSTARPQPPAPSD